MDELARIDQWITETLAADTQLVAAVSQWKGGPAIFSEIAPRDAAHPFVVVKLLAPDDVMGQGQNRVMVNAQYLVHATDTTESWQGAIRTIADRIDAVMHRANGTVTGAVICASTRLRPYRLVEDDSGVQYRHLGAEFEIKAQAS